jgi:hypothetical protein
MAFEMTGAVTDDAGAPVAGAKITVNFDDGESSDGPSALTDGSGRYTIDFTGVPGSNYYPGLDPQGTQDAVAFALVQASGYEYYQRFILGSTPQLVENIHLHPIRHMTAGESAMLTVGPDDTVCSADAWPGRELVCRIVRVLAPTDGVMNVQAVSIDPGSQPAVLQVYGSRTGAPRGNPTALQVTAGTEYLVNVEVPWGTGQSVLVKTSIQQ